MKARAGAAVEGLSGARASAALLGAPLAAFAFGSLLIRMLPVRAELAFALGAHAILPTWVSLACVLPLARNGSRAWAYCLVPVAAAAAAWALRGGP